MNAFRTMALPVVLSTVLANCSFFRDPGPPRGEELPEPIAVEGYFAVLAGPDATDCGQYLPGASEGSEESQKEVLDCAMKAIAEKRPFYFRKNGPVFDNLDLPPARGLLGTSDGRVLLYDYGGFRCPTCRERFTSEPCPNPNFYMRGNPSFPFGCEKVS